MLFQKFKLKLNYNRQSFGQSVLVSSTLLGPVTNFPFSLKFSLDSCGFVILYRPLWREGGSVIYCCCWSSPAQSRSGLSPVGLKTIFYCPNSWDSLNLEGLVPVFISPMNRVARTYPRALGYLSVASYDSQGYGGGILSRPHTGYFVSESLITVLNCVPSTYKSLRMRVRGFRIDWG
jgi:hypothetical protein